MAHDVPHSRHTSTALLSKYGIAVTELAWTLLNCIPDQRLARVQEYAERFDVSVGTVQAALGYLQSAGAAVLDARGRLGTYVRELQYPQLWSLALNRPIIGTMPMPYSRRFEGLATATRTRFAQQPLDLDLRFTRGAAQRMQMLVGGKCDWALVSRFAAETAAAHGFAIDLVMTLGPETYMARQVLLLQSDQPTLVEGMRVGIDSRSLDHVYTVRAVSRKVPVEFVEIEYSEGLRLLTAGVIDATVWSEEDIPAGMTNFGIVPLDLQSDPALARLGEAAFVVDQGNIAMLHVLPAVLDPAALLQIQQDVVKLARRPAY